MFQSIIKSKYTYWIVALYLVVLGWWFYLQAHGHSGAYQFNWFYGLIGLSGFIYAVKLSYGKWGGHKSVIGLGLLFLGLGLLGQWFGLQVWTYYNVIAKVEVPYPSWADLGYFSLIPAYTVAAIMFARAAGAKFSLRKSGGKAQVLLIPLVALSVAYWFFFRGNGLDTHLPVKTFLDIGYPFGEIIPASIGLLILTLSRSLLGGTMKNRIRFLVLAFFFQSITEYAFIISSANGTYINGGWNDLMYATSYTIMTLGIIAFREYK